MYCAPSGCAPYRALGGRCQHTLVAIVDEKHIAGRALGSSLAWRGGRRKAPHAEFPLRRSATSIVPKMCADDYWEDKPAPSDEQVTEVARAWIGYQGRHDVGVGPAVDESHPDWWAAEAVMDAHRPDRRDLQWRLIRALCALADPNDRRVIIMIGAGPLEDFIQRSGDDGPTDEDRADEAMDLVEAAVGSDPILLAALGAVWGDHSRSRIDRILAAHGQKQR